MAELDLNIDCDRFASVVSKLDNSGRPFWKFVRGDTLNLRIFLFRNYQQFGGGYEQIPVAGITLGAAIGPFPPVFGETPEYLAEQWTWTPSDDLAQPYFSGSLALATDELDAELSGETSIPAMFHVVRFESGLPKTLIFERITIYAPTIQDGGLSPTAAATALTAENAAGTYLVKEGVGYNERIPMVCPTDATVRGYFYLGDDGTMKVELET
jgi:hypothetical protein